MKAYDFNYKKLALALLLALVAGTAPALGQQAQAQAQEPYQVKSPFHNQLFFNRFLINPTFSLVRENKSYLNILHRNQYAAFEDNVQNYFLGFSNKLNERTALGIGLYGQWEGVMQEFGFNANYATAVRLGDKSKLTFGTNITYISQGLDRNRIVTPETDPTLEEASKQSQIAVQPGVALSLGRFDIALYGRELIKYNQTTNELVTGFDAKNLQAALQYTHEFGATSGLFEDGRLMPLVQVGKDAQDRFTYIGSLLLDLPSYGWFQSSFDNSYGLSMGLGFNLSQKLSLGYLMEKNITDEAANLGWNHELSLAYTFKEEDGTIYRVASNSHDRQIDDIVRNYEEQILEIRAEKDADRLVNEQSLAYENRLILDELIYRQDSIEQARTAMFEQKFENLVRTIRSEMRQQNDPAVPSPALGRRATQTAVATAESPKPVRPDNSTPVAKREFKELPIKAKNRSDVVGVSSGYYLIANVYSNKTYLDAFMKKLKEKGLDARQFYNTENGLYYVYLADFNSKKDADNAYVSNLGGQYGDEKWIMQVYNPVATADVSYQDQ